MTATDWREVNFDGLVGPSHNYAGLAHGNLAAGQNAGLISNPRAAALQGLAKMRRVAEAGIAQAFLPPPLRPDWDFLKAIGFSGSPGECLAAAQSHDPELLQSAWSAASMWTANAATVCPSVDSGDGRLHLSVANLAQQTHRALEARPTWQNLRAIFAAPELFQVHGPLPSSLGDEGAANHSRLCDEHGGPALHFFVYGRDGQRFRARQSLSASRAIARRHGLNPARCVFAEQSAAAIDAGVFHNDVICVAHRHLLLCHEQAFSDRLAVQEQLATAARDLEPKLDIHWAIASARDFSLEDAVASYVFNSQLLDQADGGIWLLAPANVLDFPGVVAWLNQLVEESALARWEAIDVQQSMRNGGGPACLRLRVALNAHQWEALPDGVKCSPAQLAALEDWVRRHYREQLAPGDLADPALASEIDAAHAELAELTGLPVAH